MTSFLIGLLRIILLLFVVRLVVRFLASLVRPAPTPAAASARGGELVRDRVCNTFVPRGRSIVARVAGHEEHFCSAACRDRALAAVSRAS